MIWTAAGSKYCADYADYIDSEQRPGKTGRQRMELDIKIS